MFQIVHLIIITVLVLLLLSSKKGAIKFNVKTYLANSKDSDKNREIPYFKGVFILGLMVGLLLGVIDNGSELLLNKIQQTRADQIYHQK